MSLPTTFFIGRGGGEPTAAPTPAYTSQGPNQYASNYGDPYVTTSNNIGLNSGSSNWVDSHNYYTEDGFGDYWYIAANWTYQPSLVWNDVNLVVNRFGNRNKTTIDPFNKGYNLLNHTTPAGVSIYTRWKAVQNMGGSQITGTSAGIFNSTVMNEKGSFFVDGDTFFNGSGSGYQTWYTDNKNQQLFPDVHTAIYNNYGTGTSTSYDFVTQGNDTGGAVYWTPQAGAQEVLIDFTNYHSNTRCALTIWNNATGSIVHTYNYGNMGGNNATGSGTINDSNSKTYVGTHNPDYVYIISDHGGTVAGSHYFLYR